MNKETKIKKRIYRIEKRLLAGVLSAAIGISASSVNFQFENAWMGNIHVSAAAKEIVCNTELLNIRTGAGTSYERVVSDGNVVYFKKGEKATVLSEQGTWYEIRLIRDEKEITGFVSADYVEVVLPASPEEEEGQEAESSETGNTSGAETAENEAGGAEANAGADSSNAGTDSTGAPTKTVITTVVETLPLEVPALITASSLRVRKKAGTDSEQLTVGDKKVSLPKNTEITILGVKTVDKQRWYQISFTYEKKTRKGYVLSDYVTLMVNGDSAISVKGRLNAALYPRTTTSTAKKYIVTYKDKKVPLKKDKKCIIIGEKMVDGVKWYQIKFYSGTKLLKGYVIAKYVDFRQTEVTKEVEVEVPNEEPNEEPTNEPTENPSGEAGDTQTPDTGTVTPSEENNTETPEETFTMQNGIVIGGPIEVRVTADVLAPYVQDAATGLNHTLTSGQTVTAYDRVEGNGGPWYLITYEMNGTMGLGFVPISYVQLADTSNGSNSSSGTGAEPGQILTDAEFEESMTAQGFPESYKPYLRSLHAAHPYWIFEANQIGMDWNTVIERESEVGVNLITNSKNLAWKSMEKGAYNWKTDKFIPYDGTTWVTASKEAVEYYMDPRNFLTESGIFQFELLSYQPAYQTETGVESILYGTPMGGASYLYQDANGVTQGITYAQTFMQAAVYSGVSPYHLASRSKQEVVTSQTSFSSSVSGIVNGYEGLYNFYNIGASHSTVAGGAVINGLVYARTGNEGKKYDDTMSFNDYIMIPWTDQYRSIVGGAAYIGSNYISRGQNTVYLEKFNMTATSTFSHQYMANVEAAASEASKTAIAYSQMSQTPIVFSIPVYQNMPLVACEAPVDQLNPNNWLKSLSVDGYTLTPSFDPSVEQEYTLIVGNEVSQVTIQAETASKKASVSGAGTMDLVQGNNTAIIIVTAENGDPRVYLLHITRE